MDDDKGPLPINGFCIDKISRGGGGGEQSRNTEVVRNSNLEILRIIAMLTIISHHYVVNSGVTEYFDFSHITVNMIFLQLWGMWGKTAINVFVLITGYFMCTKQLTVKRFMKMYLEAKFYCISFFLIFLIFGYEQLTLKNIFLIFFGNVHNIGNGFTASFFMFYLFIPFYNKLLDHLNKIEHLILIGLLLVIYTGASTFFFCSTVFNEPVWYMVLYFVAAYIKKFGANTWLKRNRKIAPIVCMLIILAYISVFFVDYVGAQFGFTNWQFMVADSNKFLAFMIGTGAFLIFNNLKIGHSSKINKIAASTFGVLCIHANSDTMRFWLWKQILNVRGMYFDNLANLILHAAISILMIFVICISIDIMRIHFIERPFMNYLTRYKWFNANILELLEQVIYKVKSTF